MRGSQVGNPLLENSYEFRRIGEEMIIDKLRGIFDEVSKEQKGKQQPFEFSASKPREAKVETASASV